LPRGIYVDEARGRTDASGVTRLAIDETAARRGQDYVTLFVDIAAAGVLRTFLPTSSRAEP
jgi:transposase